MRHSQWKIWWHSSILRSFDSFKEEGEIDPRQMLQTIKWRSSACFFSSKRTDFTLAGYKSFKCFSSYLFAFFLPKSIKVCNISSANFSEIFIFRSFLSIWLSRSTHFYIALLSCFFLLTETCPSTKFNKLDRDDL